MSNLLDLQNNFKDMLPDDERMEFMAFMGDANGVVKADKFNNVYVIKHDASVMTVRNTRVPNVVRLPIIVGYSKDNPTLLQVLRMVDAYLDAPYPSIPDHADKSHERWQHDPVFIDENQFLPGLAYPKSDTGFIIQLRGFVYYLNGWHLLDNTEVDLTAYVPATGACWMGVYVDDAKVISYLSGNIQTQKELLTPADVPDIQTDKKFLFAVMLYAGQTRIIQNETTREIFDPRFAGVADGISTSSASVSGDGFRFEVPGRLAVVANVDSPLIIAKDVTIYNWLVYLRNSGTSGASKFDVNKNGVSVFTDQGNRPEIAYDSVTGLEISGIADITSFVAGDLVTLDIDEIADEAEGLSVVASTLINVIVTVTAGQSKMAGDADPVFAYTSSVLGLLFTGALSRDAGESTGTYAINQGTLSLPAEYRIIFVSADFGVADLFTAIDATVIDTWAGSSANLIDENDATSWESSTRRNASPYCYIDLGAEKTINRVRLLQDDTSWMADQFIIQVSLDESNWTTIYTSGVTAAENIVDLIPVQARWVNVICSSGGSGSGWRVYEVSAYGW